jgi:Transcriptional Coactivator p15 (PC4)
MDAIVIAKNPIEQLRIEHRTYKGHQFIDIRTYYLDDASVWQPTRKGVTVTLDLWSDFKAAIVGLAVDEAGPRVAPYGGD